MRLLPVALLVLFPFLLGFGPPPSLIESDDARTPVGRPELGGLTTGRPPLAIGEASLLMDLTTGGVPFQRNARERVAPASLTKIMTAVIALERGRMDEEVTVAADDLVEGSAMGLRAGDRLTVEQLLWGMLIPSGNDAAQTIARTIGGGSVPRFVEMMNNKARALGMADTHFINPHGLDAEEHYSSAYDLAQLSRYAMRQPVFARIVASKDVIVEAASRTYYRRTTNQLLSLHELSDGVTGIKTGFTDKAGDCLIAAVERNGRQVLVVVMGASDRAASAASLIDYAYKQFAWVPAPAWLSGRTPVDPRFRTAAVMVPLWQARMVQASMALPTEARPLPFAAPQALLTFSVGGREQGRMALYPPPDRAGPLAGRLVPQAAP